MLMRVIRPLPQPLPPGRGAQPRSVATTERICSPLLGRGAGGEGSPYSTSTNSVTTLLLVKVVLVGRLRPRLFLGNDIPLHQVLKILVQRLHPELLPGLDRGIHLRNLVF